MENVNPTRAISEAAERLAQKLQDNNPADNQQEQQIEQQPAQPESQAEIDFESAISEQKQDQPQAESKPAEEPKKRGRKPKAKDAVEEQPAPTMSVVKKDEQPADSDQDNEIGEDVREFISYLNDDETSSGDSGQMFEADDPKSQEFQKKYEELQGKLQEYEQTLSDPLVSAFAEFVKSGNTDVNEFAKQVGALSVGELDVEAMYRMRAQEMGFEGEELEDAVLEQLDKFNSMTRLERKDEENKLRSTYKSQSAERLKSFTERMANERSTEQQRVAKIVESAEVELDEVLNKMAGQRWKSLVLDESMVKNIREAIPAFAPLMGKFDEQQKLVGFDVKDGIEMAIWKLYGKQLLKSTFDIGRTSGFDEAMKERIRPTATPGTSTAPTYPAKSTDESIADARKAAAQRASGKRSLFDVFK